MSNFLTLNGLIYIYIYIYIYINELDTIKSLLHHKKHVRGTSDIGFVAFIFAKRKYKTESVSYRSQVVQEATKIKMLLSDINL